LRANSTCRRFLQLPLKGSLFPLFGRLSDLQFLHL